MDKLKKDYIRANEVLNRDNQGFIGQEVQDTSLQQVEGTLNLEEDFKKDTDKVLSKSSIVHEIDIDNLYPSSLIEIEVSGNGEYNVPGQLMVNNSVSILTKSNHDGWSLKPGDILEYSFEKYESEVVSNQTLIIGYIQDGIMKEGKAINTMSGTYVYEAQEEGIYYIYLMSASSVYLALKDGTLKYYPG